MLLTKSLPFNHFRQDSGDWLGNFIANAVQVVSLVMSVVSPGGGGGGSGGGSSGPPTVDRVDTRPSGSSGESVDDLDYAMGTLMAYGGKYLRELAVYAWEYGTQTPITNPGGVSSSVAQPAVADLAAAATSSVASVATKVSQAQV